MTLPTDSYTVRSCDGVHYWSLDERNAVHHAINLSHSGKVNGLITVGIRGFVIYRCFPSNHLAFFNKALPEKLGGYYMFAET